MCTHYLHLIHLPAPFFATSPLNVSFKTSTTSYMGYLPYGKWKCVTAFKVTRKREGGVRSQLDVTYAILNSADPN
jgi:hypothetical protein